MSCARIAAASRSRNAAASATGPRVDDKAVEIVVVVLAFELVHRGAGGEVVLGGGGEAERDRRRDPAVARRRRACTPGRSRAAISRRSAASSSGATRSVLLRITRSAQASWSPNTSSSGLSWSIAGSAARCARDRVGIVGEAAGGERGGVDHGEDAVDRRRGADFGPGERLHQRLRQRQARGLDRRCGRAATARSISRVKRRQEIVGDRAAEAAIRQLDDVVVAAGRVAAAEQQLAVDAELAELVDDDRQAVAGGGGDQMAHQAGLAGAEKAGDDRRGDAPHGSASLQHQRQAGGDEHDAVGERGDLLVEPAGGVAEIGGRAGSPARGRARPRWRPARPGPPASRSAAHSAREFVLDGAAGAAAGSTATGSGNRPGAAGRGSASRDDRRRQGRAAPRRCARKRRGAPRCAAMRAAISASPGLGGGEIGAAPPRRLRQRLGIAALARAGAAQDQASAGAAAPASG